MKVSKTALIPLFIFLAAAARPASAEWALGPLGGANLSQSEDGHMDARTLTGWAVGARLQMGMMPFLSLMFDPMLVQTPAQFESAAPTADGRGDFVFLEVPVLLNARVDFYNLGMFAFIGPNLQLNTDARGSVQSQRDLDREDMNPAGLAGQVGAGLAFGVAPFIDLTADARYSHGFTNLLAGAQGDLETWRTRDVRINMGVLLHTPRMGALFRPGNAFRSQPD